MQGIVSIALPELVLCLTALTLLLVGAVAGQRATSLISILSGAALLIAAALAAMGPTGSAFAGGFIADPASAFARTALMA